MNFSPILQQQLRQQLATMVEEMQLNLSTLAQDKIIRYLDLLVLWNKSYNLTAIREPEEMLVKHIADSLVVAPYIQGQRIIDVGTGAGFPGIPLSLVFPETQWTLLDSNGKKTRFLLQMKAELQLANVNIVQSRISDYKPEKCYDGLITRAWTQLEVMMEQVRHVCCPGAKLWAMKGRYPSEELQNFQQNYEVIALKVPGLSDQRHLICWQIGGKKNL